MENSNIRDFGEANEETIDSISNDGSSGNKRSQLKAKLKKKIELKMDVDESDSDMSVGPAGEKITVVVDVHPEPKELTQKGKLTDKQGGDEGEELTTTSSSMAMDVAEQEADVQPQLKQKGCDKCGKKFGLTGGFYCRCGGTFCNYHRYSDRHDCNFDYRDMGANQIRRDNPLIVPEKLRKV